MRLPFLFLMTSLDHLRNVGYLSDLIFHEYSGTIKSRSDYLVIRSPLNPHYLGGNLLLFKHAPQMADYESWIAVAQQEFGADAPHVAFGWDAEERGYLEDFLANGFEFKQEVALALNELAPLARPNHDLQVRRISAESEWQSVLELQTPPGSSEAYMASRRALLSQYRYMQRDGRGDWWGAFEGSTLVGSLGLYFSADKSMGRFQQIDTHPNHRNKGVCSTLLHHVAQRAIRTRDSVELIVVTGDDSPARRIYAAAGFEECARRYGASLPRPYSRRFEVSARRQEAGAPA